MSPTFSSSAWSHISELDGGNHAIDLVILRASFETEDDITDLTLDAIIQTDNFKMGFLEFHTKSSCLFVIQIIIELVQAVFAQTIRN